MLRIYILLLFLFSAAIHAQPVIHEQYANYKITGNSAGELRRQMSMLGPTDMTSEHFDASTKWFVKWQYRYLMDGNQCYFTNVNVNVDVTYHFPEWVDFVLGSYHLQKHWNIYMQHLLTHERGHAEHGIEAAAEIDKALTDLPAMQSCEELENTADHIAYQIIAKYNTEDMIYEDDTDHGARQGATFP